MTIFDSDADFRDSNTSISAWAAIRAVLHEHVASYNNRHPIGKVYPARIVSETDHSIILECARGATANDPHRLVMITVESSIDAALITGTSERWKHGPGGSRRTESIKTYQFSIADSSPLAFTYKGNLMSPTEVMETILESLRSDRP